MRQMFAVVWLVAACERRGDDDAAAPDDDVDAGPEREPRCWAQEPTWSTEEVDPEAAVGVGAAIALDADGFAHIAYRVYLGDSIVRYATNRSGEWVVVELAARTGSWAALALDSEGGPRVAFTSGTTGRGDSTVRMARYVDLQWDFEDVASSYNGEPQGLVLGADGTAYVAYFNCIQLSSCGTTGNALSIASDRTGSWSSEDVAISTESTRSEVPGDASDYLAAGSDGRLHLLAAEREHDRGNAPLAGRLVVWSGATGAWEREVIAAQEGDSPHIGSIDTDPSGDPVVAFIQETYEDGPDGPRLTETSPLMLARRGRDEWTSEQVDVLGSFPGVFGVEVDRSGAVTVLYRSEFGVARLGTDACGPWEQVDLPPIDRAAAVTVDEDGQIAIAYFRPQAEGGLWFATLDETFEPRN